MVQKCFNFFNLSRHQIKVWTILCILLYSMPGLAVSGRTVTFSGSGYISNQITMTSTNDVIQLDIRTKRASCILFYTGNQNEKPHPNHIFLYIRDGILYLDMAFKDNVHTAQMKTGSSGRFDDNQWHSIRIDRKEHNLRVRVDERLVHEQHAPSKSEVLLWSRRIFLGGAQHLSLSPVKDNFKGCIKLAHYKADNTNLDLLALAHESRHGFRVHGDIKFTGCHDPFSHQSITFKQPTGSLIVRTARLSLDDYSLAFAFRTNEPNGLLLYQPSLPIERDFLAFELRSAYLFFHVSVSGESVTRRVSSRRVVDGVEKRVTFTFGFNRVRVQLDQDPPVTLTLAIKVAKRLTLAANMFLGGIGPAQDNMALPYQVWNGILRRGFVGCFLTLKVNSETVDLAGALISSRQTGGSDVLEEGCTSSSTGIRGLCSPNPCMNGASCTEGWNRYVCDCSSTDYHGDRCERVAPVATFDGTQFMRIDLGREQQTQTEELTLRFRTRYGNGLLFRTANPNSVAQDRMELQLVDGRIRLVINLEREPKIYKMYDPVNDNKWHTIKVLRENASLLTILDGKKLFHELDSKATFLNSRQINLGLYAEKAPLFTIPQNPLLPSKRRRRSLDFENVVNSRLLNDDIINPSLATGDISMDTAFVGNMMHFRFNGIDYFLQPAVSADNVEATGQMALKLPSANYDFPLTFHTPSCFIGRPPLSLHQRFIISFWFRTKEASGLILMDRAELSRDLILIELVGGYLHLAFNMGAGLQRQVSTRGGLNDGNWHWVEMAREDLVADIVTFRVNGEPRGSGAGIPVLLGADSDSGRAGASSRRRAPMDFRLDRPAFLGGVPDDEYIRYREIINSARGFKGCMASFSVNGDRPEDLLRSPQTSITASCQTQVIPGCPRLPFQTTSSQLPGSSCIISAPSKSTSLVCINGGRCIQQWNSGRCDCQPTSFSGEICDKVSNTIKFGTPKAIGYAKVEYKDRTRNTTRDELVFGLQTTTNQGSLFYVQSEDITGDYIHLYLRDGRLQVDYDMGAGTQPLDQSTLYIADGDYHRIRLVRDGKNAGVFVDQTFTLKETKSNFGTHFNRQQSLWLGFSPYVKHSQYFKGYISGMVFNNLPVTDMIWESEEASYTEVTKFGVVKNAINFQPKFPLGSNLKSTPSISKSGSDRLNQQLMKEQENDPNNSESLDAKNKEPSSIVVPRQKCLSIPTSGSEQCLPDVITNSRDPLRGELGPIVRGRVTLHVPQVTLAPISSVPTLPPWSGQISPPHRPGQNDATGVVQPYQPVVIPLPAPSESLKPEYNPSQNLPPDDSDATEENTKQFNLSDMAIPIWMVIALVGAVVIFLSLVGCLAIRCTRRTQPYSQHLQPNGSANHQTQMDEFDKLSPTPTLMLSQMAPGHAMYTGNNTMGNGNHQIDDMDPALTPLRSAVDFDVGPGSHYSHSMGPPANGHLLLPDNQTGSTRKKPGAKKNKGDVKEWYV